MRIKAKRAVALACSAAVFAAVPAAPAVAGGGGGGNGKKGGDSQKVGPNQCRNQKGIQVNVISCNNVDFDGGLL